MSRHELLRIAGIGALRYARHVSSWTTGAGVKCGGSRKEFRESTVSVRDTAELQMYPELPKDP